MRGIILAASWACPRSLCRPAARKVVGAKPLDYLHPLHTTHKQRRPPLFRFRFACRRTQKPAFVVCRQAWQWAMRSCVAPSYIRAAGGWRLTWTAALYTSTSTDGWLTADGSVLQVASCSRISFCLLVAGKAELGRLVKLCLPRAVAFARSGASHYPLQTAAVRQQHTKLRTWLQHTRPQACSPKGINLAILGGLVAWWLGGGLDLRYQAAVYHRIHQEEQRRRRVCDGGSQRGAKRRRGENAVASGACPLLLHSWRILRAPAVSESTLIGTT
jgi:hypothetical protein